jgi:hypothetical protein
VRGGDREVKLGPVVWARFAWGWLARTDDQRPEMRPEPVWHWSVLLAVSEVTAQGVAQGADER